MRIAGASGFIGIGTTTPQAQLEVHGPNLNSGTGSAGSIAEMTRFSANNGNVAQIRFTTNRYLDGNSWLSASTRMQVWTDVTPQGYIDFNPNGASYGIAFGNGTAETMRLLQGGNLLIGKTSTNNPSYMLDVNGTGRLNTVVVNATGADYVFDPGYRLSSLHDLETYVTKEHHLPGIAPAAQMQQEGVNLGDNQTCLLAKIEELTLYLIQEDRRSTALQEKIKQLEDRNKALEARDRLLGDLEKRVQLLEQRDR
jgi:hypothetical protein